MYATLAQLSFSALQRAENSSISRAVRVVVPSGTVSVLFSEPKIPQSADTDSNRRNQRRFQCSSASRKFLNFDRLAVWTTHGTSFSALQRAENSSISSSALTATLRALQFQCSSASRKFLNSETRSAARCASKFQCSSASRKFLKRTDGRSTPRSSCRFSALQRAENSSNSRFR